MRSIACEPEQHFSHLALLYLQSAPIPRKGERPSINLGDDTNFFAQFECAPLSSSQSPSEHIHSRYVRCIADLPWMGWEVQLELHTRRFFCLNLACPRQIFVERVPSVVAPYARRTTRLTEMFTLIGFALGGEAGARLSTGMSLPTSPDTLLHLIRARGEQPTPVLRVIGVDDFSFCKRKSYGTIIIDLEKRMPVDLLPDRESETLAQWLREHPGIQIVSRDRAGPYAEGIR